MFCRAGQVFYGSQLFGSSSEANLDASDILWGKLPELGGKVSVQGFVR